MELDNVIGNQITMNTFRTGLWNTIANWNRTYALQIAISNMKDNKFQLQETFKIVIADIVPAAASQRRPAVYATTFDRVSGTGYCS